MRGVRHCTHAIAVAARALPPRKSKAACRLSSEPLRSLNEDCGGSVLAETGKVIMRLSNGYLMFI